MDEMDRRMLSPGASQGGGMKRVLRFRALDDATVEVPIPKGVNPFLAQKAIERVHKGGDVAAAMFELTRSETEFVASVIAKLEEHKAKAGAA